MLFQRLLKAIISGKVKGHFSQYGEDIIIHKLFPRKNYKGLYIDIGAFHPFKFSNTAYLWAMGWKGINIDANNNSIRKFKKFRPNDLNIYGAVVDSKTSCVKSSIPIYVKNEKKINAIGTCDAELANKRDLVNSLNVPTISVNSIFEKVINQKIDFLNIDIEGLDESILTEIDFEKYKPKVICIEDYNNDLSSVLTSDITKKLYSKGYYLKARVGPSSVFVHSEHDEDS